MKPESAILMACVGLACGAVGLGLGASWRAAGRAEPGPRAKTLSKMGRKCMEPWAGR